MLRNWLLTGLVFAFCGFGTVTWAYEVVPVRGGVTVSGEVALIGKLPPPKLFAVQKSPEICGFQRTLAKVKSLDGKLQEVVIALEGVEKGKAFPHRSDKDSGIGQGIFGYAGGQNLNLKVDLKKCSFGPFVGVIKPNESVSFINKDPVRHTLHSYVLKGHAVQIMKTLYAQSLRPEKKVVKAFSSKKLGQAQAVILTCDRHEFMENWLYPVRNPYYAISDEMGRFEIQDIPPGKYKVVAWHPLLGRQQKEIVLDAYSIVNISFVFEK